MASDIGHPPTEATVVGSVGRVYTKLAAGYHLLTIFPHAGFVITLLSLSLGHVSHSPKGKQCNISRCGSVGRFSSPVHSLRSQWPIGQEMPVLRANVHFIVHSHPYLEYIAYPLRSLVRTIVYFNLDP